MKKNIIALILIILLIVVILFFTLYKPFMEKEKSIEKTGLAYSDTVKVQKIGLGLITTLIFIFVLAMVYITLYMNRLKQ